MESSTSHTKTTAASTKQYRTKELSKRGIFFRKSPFAINRLPNEVKAPLRLCALLDLEVTFDDIIALTLVEARSEDVAAAREVVLEVERCLEDAGNEDIWTRNLWTKRVYPFLDDDRDLLQSANSNWDAPVETAQFRIAGLGKPKPDIAYGFKVPLSRKKPYPLLSDAVMEAIENDAALNLHPRPSPHNNTNLAYPAFMHEVKPANGTQQYAENQLAKSLVFAMDQQEELREAAVAIDPDGEGSKSNLPLIGITSIGEKMTIFYAVDNSDQEVDIVEYEVLDLSQPRQAYAAILFVRAVAHWLKDAYRARILELLKTVYKDHLARRQARIVRALS